MNLNTISILLAFGKEGQNHSGWVGLGWVGLGVVWADRYATARMTARHKKAQTNEKNPSRGAE